MSSGMRVMLLLLATFASLLILGYFAQQHPWWYEWGAKAAITTWLLIWIAVALCLIAPYLDDNKEQ